MRRKCIIIGSGLGGLSSGIILAKNGFDVTVLEQSAQIGGCLQCFVRKGIKFETGMHFIGSADKNQSLYRYLNYLGIRDKVPLSRLDPTGYDVVSMYGEKFAFPNGKEKFIDRFSTYFPKEKDGIARYYNLMREVAEASSLHSLNVIKSDMPMNMTYQLRSINDVLEEIIHDPLLQQVLVGNMPLYAARKDKTPFSTHAFIVDFYNQSAFRIIGGSDILSKSLSDEINNYGGRILTKHKVKQILCNEEKAIGVITEEGSFFEADIIISDIHPVRVLEMLDTKLIRPAFRSRINAILNTIGGFSLYLQFKENVMPYMNHNFYGYQHFSPWEGEDYNEETWPKNYLYMHSCHEIDPKFAQSGVILSYMNINELSKWENTYIGRRGMDYETLKKRKAEKLLAVVEQDFPGIRDKIANYYTATPLTYRDYTGTQEGSLYGIAKDINLGTSCRIPHKTKVPNLYLTGQNINTHGMLGVLVGAIITCSELIGVGNIYNQIMEANE